MTEPFQPGEVSQPFDAYYELLGIPPAEQSPTLYRLLGLSAFESNSKVIERSADRQMSHLRSFKTGEPALAAQMLPSEVAKASRVLLTPEEKAPYDAAGCGRRLCGRRLRLEFRAREGQRSTAFAWERPWPNALCQHALQVRHLRPSPSRPGKAKPGAERQADVRLRRPVADLQIIPAYRLADQGWLGLASWQSAITFLSCKVRLEEGPGEFTRIETRHPWTVGAVLALSFDIPTHTLLNGRAAVRDVSGYDNHGFVQGGTRFSNGHSGLSAVSTGLKTSSNAWTPRASGPAPR